MSDEEQDLPEEEETPTTPPPPEEQPEETPAPDEEPPVEETPPPPPPEQPPVEETPPPPEIQEESPPLPEAQRQPDAEGGTSAGEEKVVPKTDSKTSVQTPYDDGELDVNTSKISLRRQRGKQDQQEGEGELEQGEDELSHKEKFKKEAKMKHSITGHLELQKHRLMALKQAREDRRSQLDMTHHFLMEIVAAHIDLKEKDVEEFIIDSPAFITAMDKFFEKKGNKAVFFIYQEADPAGPESGRHIQGKRERMLRVLVSDGTEFGLKGKVMYFLRVVNDNKILMKTIADELYFGLLDISDPDEPGVAIDAVSNTLNSLLIPYLQFNPSWINVPDAELAENIRHKFLTSITHYAEFLADCKNDITSRLDLSKIADMTELVENHLYSPKKVLEAAKNPEIVSDVERIVVLWCKNIERVLALSKLMRKDSDTMGPNAELAYWRNLNGKMSFIISQIQEPAFTSFIMVLLHSKSKVLRRWKDVDARVTDDFFESKDNVRYMYALSKFVEPLYQLDPVEMVQYIPSMIYTIQTIHRTSRYYNSCEKLTALLVKISNQMVFACRQYLTKDGTETIWDQDKRSMIEKFKKCLELYATYRNSYETTKAELQETPDGKQFNFSVNHIFGRYDQFCERLRKIITLLEIFDMYKFVHESHIDGIDKISERLQELFKTIKKSYDPLEFRQPDFDKDFVAIRSELDEIQKDLEAFMDKAIDNCATAMHCLELLERFANLHNRCLNIEEKQWYAFQFYFNEINMLKGVYESEKNDTPIPRGYPPFAGKIAWARHLFKRLERPMKYFETKTKILEREDARPVIQAYNGLAKKLVYYEIIFHDAWFKQTASIYDSLEAPLLTLRGSIRQELILNFDPFFRQIIDETEIIRKLDLDIPDVAQIVYYRQDKILSKYEKMKSLLDKFLQVKSKIPNDLIVLVRNLLKRVEKSFMPGVTSINWTSYKCDEFFEYIQVHLEELETIANKIDDTLTFRINQTLWDMCHTLMIDLPEDKPMSVQDYMERIHTYGKLVAKDLEYKSRHCEAAVIELINIILATNEINVPDEILYAWMNADLFAKPKGGTDSKSTIVGGGTKGKKIKHGQDEAKAGMYNAMIKDLPQSVKDDVNHFHEECRHVFYFYSTKCVEALQKTTRHSLDLLRRRTEEPQVNKRNTGKTDNRIPLFYSDFVVAIPNIVLKPPLEETQRVLTRSVGIITDILKAVIGWGQNRRTSFDVNNEESFYKDPAKEAATEVATYERLQSPDAYIKAPFAVESPNPKLKNCQKAVLDYKDITKMIVIMQSSVTQAKQRVQVQIAKYLLYNFLWRADRDDEIKQFVMESPAITEVQAVVKKYNKLIDEIDEIVPYNRIGPLEISTAELKLGLEIEVRAWKQSLCKLLADDYREKVANIAKFIEDVNKLLTTDIKDLLEIKHALEAMSKVRANFVDQEALLTPIEECYSFLSNQSYKVPNEDLAKAENLRFDFQTLQAKTLAVQNKINTLQEEHRKKLQQAIYKFGEDVRQYLSEYNERGPMLEGLSPAEASHRLMLFQDRFDILWEKYLLYLDGERIFGFVPKEYPEFFKHKKELALLQKLYGLFNDVMRSLETYAEVKWVQLNFVKIKTEIANFQDRCQKLPKALKDWPAFILLKQKIDDFNETCPLLEHMSSSAMKERHWEQIGDITSYVFDFQNENFALKDVMGAPLLKFKDEVDDVALGSVREREIEGILKQLLMNWSMQNLLFERFKHRGEIVLREEETQDIMIELKKTIDILQGLIDDRYSVPYKKELKARFEDFSNTLHIIEEWLKVQKFWSFLEGILVGGEIARQLPLEAKRFRNVDRSWVKIMTRARESPVVVPCCVGDETMMKVIPHMMEQLLISQAAYEEYMEAKRLEEEEAQEALEAAQAAAAPPMKL